MEYLFTETVGEDVLLRVYADRTTGVITRIVLRGNSRTPYTLYIGDPEHRTGQYITPTTTEREVNLDLALSSKISTTGESQMRWMIGLEGGVRTWQSPSQT